MIEPSVAKRQSHERSKIWHKVTSGDHNFIEDSTVSTLLAIYGMNMCNQRKMVANESAFNLNLSWIRRFLKCVSRKVRLQEKMISMVFSSRRGRYRNLTHHVPVLM